MLGECLDRTREKKPLAHNITNYVTVNDVANSVLAVGASPIMSDDEAEVEEITSICDCLNVNIGTLNSRTIRSMFLAAKKAEELGHKTLLDPVGAGASALRTKTAIELSRKSHFDVIRANISEMKALAEGRGSTRGVDADSSDAVTESNMERAVSFAKNFSCETGSVIAITGAIDIVADAEKAFVIRNGRAEMGRVTGTGCCLSAIACAFIASSPDTLSAAAAAVCAMGLAGEIAWSAMREGDGNAAYRTRIIDALFNMTGSALDKGARYETR